MSELKSEKETTERVVTLVGGERLTNVHPSDKCKGEYCCIHNPSDHHMKTWPQHWRSDRGITERICEHGCGHPDPDDPTGDTIHGCDGCCQPPPYGYQSWPPGI